MKSVPPLSTKRFEQLEVGDLFIFFDRKGASYALKTQPQEAGDPNSMVLLGPSFTEGINESFLLPWQPTTVLSLGKGFSILPSLTPSSWSSDGPSRIPVSLAVSGTELYICTNGASSPNRFLPNFVEVGTGKIIKQHLHGAIFTSTWDLVVLGANHPPLSILKYPLADYDIAAKK